jgi:hypothetical protein
LNTETCELLEFLEALETSVGDSIRFSRADVISAAELAGSDGVQWLSIQGTEITGRAAAAITFVSAVAAFSVRVQTAVGIVTAGASGWYFDQFFQSWLEI